MQLEKRYFLSQGTTSFTGALILAPITLQNISDGGINAYNVAGFTVVVVLLLNALALLSAACFKFSKVEKYARFVTSSWSRIPLIFFCYSWIIGIAKLITLHMVDWQVYIFAAIGFLFIVVSVIFSFSKVNEQTNT